VDHTRPTPATGPPPPGTGAVVFDCDGTLVDTETCWTRAYTTLFHRYEQVFTHKHKQALIGRHLNEIGGILARLLDQPLHAETLLAGVHQLVLDHLAAGVPPMPGAVELVTELTGTRPLAVASSSPRRLVRRLLHDAGLSGIFDAVLGAEDATHPKPAPDIYLRACAALHVPASAAVAIEDSPLGVTAAATAGLYVIGIPSSPDMPLPGAHLIAHSLTDPRGRAALQLDSAAELPQASDQGSSRRASSPDSVT
jgi:HAD superfamily hydrolase (TIGR01509 family)